MKLTTEEIMERINAYVNYAHRIKEIKDLLLDFEIYGEEDIVEAAMIQQEELLREIHVIYQERMLPIVEEIARHVDDNRHLLTQPRREPTAEEASQREVQAEQPEGEAEDPDAMSRSSAKTLGDAFLSSMKKNLDKK
ncbi:MAG: hypothetical protein RDV48_13970 [Candidatus Eremiobacteraeota bacterium]|nr:hypothetical protein [Candidatus Eremiobacteraeota bacterium]